MAKLQERVVIRRAEKDAREGAGGRSSGVRKKAGLGLVENVLESLRAADEPAKGAPSVDQSVKLDERAMAKVLREMAGNRDSLRRQKAASLAGGLDPVLQATLFRRG